MATVNEDDWVQIYRSCKPDGLDKEEDIRELIENAELTNWKSPTYTENAPEFIIKNGEDLFARVKMTGSSLEYTVTSVDMEISGTQGDSITVPEGVIVYCNGVALSEEYRAEASSIKLDGYEDSLNGKKAYYTYEVSGLLSKPELTLKTVNDEELIVTDKEGNYYIALNSDKVSNIKNDADSFIKSLLYYYKMGKTDLSENMESALSHVVSGSEAAKVIRQSADGVKWRYSDTAKYETTASDVYVIADNCYVVDVTYIDTTKENPETLGYRVYFLDMGQGFKIYNFSML